ncbi:Gfo/Idh/MocA family protein [Actinokineospora sp. HUAS TT18]|uniref:Gfo/Idh/MocA family protein n=1 Tax=Actinokineospora sp. HUAS TT18 TaxID=3447451 RepID=UPI003F5219A4
MSRRTIGIAMNGVTGRMGYRQHLLRSILAIRLHGGVPLADGTVIWPEPLLIGRSEHKLAELAEKHGIAEWTTDLHAALARDDIEIYFDAVTTLQREKNITAAIEAGKHIYTEKPLATDHRGALELAAVASAAGVRNGVVADKIFLPGLLKLKRLVDSGFFGRVLSVRGEFGYWVFEGDLQRAQRPSWNYRAEDGGGMVLDMFPHWHYLLEHLFGEIKTVQATTATHIPTRWDENDAEYSATADDAAYGTFELEGGVIAQVNSSWCTRVFRDELVEFQVDGTHGSAVAGLHRCRAQSRTATPMPVWDPDKPSTIDARGVWSEVPDNAQFDNGFKVQWELFLKHVVTGSEFPWDFAAAARGVQFAELGLRSAREGRKFALTETS